MESNYQSYVFKNYETILNEDSVNGLLKTNVWELLHLAIVQCKKGIYLCFRLLLSDKFGQLDFCKPVLIKASFSYFYFYRMKAEQDTSYKYV